MLSPRILFWLGVVALLGTTSPVLAQCCPSACAPAPCAPVACAPPAPQFVEQTIMCPTWVTENRTVTETACRAEVRQSTYTVYQMVPETRAIQRQCTVMVPQVQTRTEQYTVCQPVWRTETRQYTVMVPTCETRQATRQVCQMVPVKQMQTVCEDQGHWEQRSYAPACPSPCAPACGGCGTCRSCCSPCTYSCWVPNIVQKQIEVTCMQPQVVSVPYTYQVTVCKPEVRSTTVQVCSYQQIQQTRNVNFTVCVPQAKTWTENVTTCKCVPIQKTCQYTVMVPYQVQKTVQVQVCKMVPKTIQVPVCAPAPCETGCCRPHRCHHRCRC